MVHPINSILLLGDASSFFFLFEFHLSTRLAQKRVTEPLFLRSIVDSSASLADRILKAVWTISFLDAGYRLVPAFTKGLLRRNSTVLETMVAMSLYDLHFTQTFESLAIRETESCPSLRGTIFRKRAKKQLRKVEQGSIIVGETEIRDKKGTRVKNVPARNRTWVP